MNLLIEHLRANTVESLEALGIYARRSTVNPAKFSLNYDMIEAQDGHPVVNLCRGAVLRDPRTPGGDYEYLARPFNRFFNLGSGHAAPLDWGTAVFEEKLDGTCCIVYFDPDMAMWCVATRSVPDADLANPGGETFSEMFWRTFGSDQSTLHQHITYVFELTGPGNQIVVPYDDWATTLLAAFETVSGREVPELRRAPAHPFRTLEDAKAWSEKQAGHTHEGFVVRDAAGNRVKVKSSQYLAVAKVMTAAGSDTGLLSIVLSGTADDVRQILPDEKNQKIEQFTAAYRKFVFGIEAFAASLPPSDRKTAALAIQASPYASWIGVVLDLWPSIKKFGSFSEWLDAQRKKSQGVLGDSLVEKILHMLAV